MQDQSNELIDSLPRDYGLKERNILKINVHEVYKKLLIIKYMNTQNLEFLETNLKYFGFGDKLSEELKKNIADQQKEFQLEIEIPHYNNKMDYQLHFKKSDTTGMYFFNSYDAKLLNSEAGFSRDHTFFVNKGNGVTAKEAFNLLEGRSVYKNLVNRGGEKYNAWLKLDFENTDQFGNFKIKQFSDQYGYDLNKTLRMYPIKELGSDDQKKALIYSLQKGNAQQVTVNQNGKESKYFIEAVPQYKNLNIYDQKRRVVKRESLQKQDSHQGKDAGQTTKNKKTQKAEADEGKAKPKKSRGKKV